MANLQGCPEEIVESIVELLALQDHCNLRRCSRTLACKATQPRFGRYFNRKTVPLHIDALNEFVRVTEEGSQLGCLVQHLVIIGNAHEAHQWDYGSERESRRRAATNNSNVSQRQSHDVAIGLLSRALVCIAAAHKQDQHSIKSLTLTISDTRKHPRSVPWNRHARKWRPIWLCAAFTFHVAMSSLAASQLRAEELSVFDDNPPVRCSLACNVLEDTLKSVDLSVAFRSLKHLTLCFSDTEDSSKVQGLRRLLELTPSLQHLNLRQFSIGAGNLPGAQYDPTRESSYPARPGTYIMYCDASWTTSPSVAPNRAQVFRNATEMAVIPRLERLTLCGIDTTGDDLLRFVRGSSPAEITLARVHLVSGTYMALFGYCSSESAHVQTHNFNDLAEANWSVFFHAPDRFDTLQRSGAMVQTQISYHAPVGAYRQAHQGQSEHRAEVKRLYGPI